MKSTSTVLNPILYPKLVLYTNVGKSNSFKN